MTRIFYVPKTAYFFIGLWLFCILPVVDATVILEDVSAPGTDGRHIYS